MLKRLLNKIMQYFFHAFGKTHGALYDLVFVVVSSLFAFVVQFYTFNFNHDAIRIFLIVFILFQVAGAILKRGPMHLRMKKPGTDKQGCFWSIILVYYAVYIVFVMIGIIGMDAQPNNFDIILALLIGTVSYIFVARALFAPNKVKTYPKWQEYTADILLAFSAIIISQIFWEPLISGISGSGNSWIGNPSNEIISIIIYSLLLLLIFTTYYIMPRMILLYEDGGKAKTWLRIFIIFFISYVRIAIAYVS